MKSRLGLAVLALAALSLEMGALTATTGTSAYAAETCFGLAPTLVTGPGQAEFMGTEGDDVIVDNYGRTISSLGGNDAICSVGSGLIDAGDGNDKVSVTNAVEGNFFYLGRGSDQFVGSDADDRVVAGTHTETDVFEGAVGDIDTITTYGGDDSVFSLTKTYPNADVVDLGPGADNIRLSSPAGATFDIKGGDGHDALELDQYGIEGDVGLDLQTTMVAIGGRTVAHVSGVEDASGSSDKYQVVLRGTSSANVLNVSSPLGKVFAGSGADVVTVQGCGSMAQGNGGNDRLRSYSSVKCGAAAIALTGGGGNDRLRGGQGRDVLFGNVGNDTADGGNGQDRCRAEIEHSCETN